MEIKGQDEWKGEEEQEKFLRAPINGV